MQFKRLHQGFQLPQRGSSHAGGYDIFMPDSGCIPEVDPADTTTTHKMVPLGFAARVPEGHVALILPRSGAGAKHGIELRNTVGVIDADYTGEWMAAVKQKEGVAFSWQAGERLFQFILVPVATADPHEVDELAATARGLGGFGSTGQ